MMKLKKIPLMQFLFEHRLGLVGGVAALAATLVLWGCQPFGSNPSGRDDARSGTEAKIERVVTGLTTAYRIQGEPLQKMKLSDRMGYYGVPGVSVAVFIDGRIEWARGFGWADAEQQTPVTPETLFQAASISKPVAALAALSLVEEGVVVLDQDVNHYLESWKVPPGKQGDDNPVTIRGLLSHTAGMTVHWFPGYAASARLPTLEQILAGTAPANTEAIVNDEVPGKEYRYSGGGYTVLQRLVTDVTGEAFAPFLAKRVFEPLGLENSTYEQPLPESRHQQAASAHAFLGVPIEGRFHTYPELAAAGLWTTPGDLAQIAIEVQQSLRGESNRILSRDMTEQMLEPVLDSYGLGFATFESGGHRYFGHNGSNEGFRCELVASHEGGFGTVIMTNGERGDSLYGELLRAIAGAYGWPGFESRERKAIPLDDAMKRELTGTYEVPGLGELRILQHEGTLVLDGLIFSKERLYVSDNDLLFSLSGQDIGLERAQDGSVTALVSELIVAKKTK
jgi:CubicO group peptidase (beta-lactamase class C family)